MSIASPSPLRSFNPASPSPSHQRPTSSKDNIQVVCRVRPMNSREVAENSSRCLSVVHDSCKVGDKVFTFNQVYGENAKQHELFESVGLPVIDGVFQGFNGTIFAYGQTGSGKTYTMMGPDIESDTDSELRGIIPRSIEVIFNRIGTLDDMQCTVHVSFFEIYNERVNDLLNPKIKNIDMRNMNAEWEEVLTHKTVNGLPKAIQLLVQGLANRKTGATDMNAISSRSHSIFVISIKQTNSLSKTSLVSKLYLVDLAGSEKQKKTRSTGERFKEGTNINKSLFVLSRVINALTQNLFVPYRDSVLTKVLKHSLGGNCKTALVINVSPSTFNEGETVSTLQFGANAKKIKNDPRINLLDDNSETAMLKSIVETQRIEIAELKRHIDRLTGRDLMNSSMNDSLMGHDISLNMSSYDIVDDNVDLSPSGPLCCSSCLRSMEERERDLTQQYVELKAKVRELVKKVQKMNETQMAYNKRLGDLQKLEKEMKNIKEQSEQHQSLVKKHADLTESIAKNEVEIAKLTKTSVKQESSLAELKEKITREESDYNALKTQYDEYVAEHEMMLQKVNDLKSERETLSVECMDLVQLVAGMRKKKDQFNVETIELTATLSKAESILKEKQELELKTKNMIVKVSRENDRLADQLIVVSSDLTETNNKYVQIKDELRQKEVEIEQLKSQYDSFVATREDLEKKSTAESEAIKQLEDNLATLSSKHNFLQASLNNETNANQSLTNQLTSVRNSIDRNQTTLKDAKAKEQSLVQDIERLTTDIRMLKDQKHNLVTERDSAKSSIPDIERELTLVTEEREKLEQELMEQRRVYDNIVSQGNRLRDALIMCENQSESYRQQILALESEMNSKREQVDNCKRMLEKYTEQKKYFECQFGIIKIQTDTLHNKIYDLQSCKLELEQRTREVSQNIAELTEEFNQKKYDKQLLVQQIFDIKEVIRQLNEEHETYAQELDREKNLIGDLGKTLNSKMCEVNDHHSKMEEALKEIQREMKEKMDYIAAQSLEFEQKIFSLTKRKMEVSRSQQSEITGDDSNSNLDGAETEAEQQ